MLAKVWERGQTVFFQVLTLLYTYFIARTVLFISPIDKLLKVKPQLFL